MRMAELAHFLYYLLFIVRIGKGLPQTHRFGFQVTRILADKLNIGLRMTPG